MFGIRRREFITLLGGGAAWPLVANAQQPPKIKIGVLAGFAEDDPEIGRSQNDFCPGNA